MAGQVYKAATRVQALDQALEAAFQVAELARDVDVATIQMREMLRYGRKLRVLEAPGKGYGVFVRDRATVPCGTLLGAYVSTVSLCLRQRPVTSRCNALTGQGSSGRTVESSDSLSTGMWGIVVSHSMVPPAGSTTHARVPPCVAGGDDLGLSLCWSSRPLTTWSAGQSWSIIIMVGVKMRMLSQHNERNS